MKIKYDAKNQNVIVLVKQGVTSSNLKAKDQSLWSIDNNTMGFNAMVKHVRSQGKELGLFIQGEEKPVPALSVVIPIHVARLILQYCDSCEKKQNSDQGLAIVNLKSQMI